MATSSARSASNDSCAGEQIHTEASGSWRATAPPGRARRTISATAASGSVRLSSSVRSWTRSKELDSRPVAVASAGTVSTPGTRSAAQREHPGLEVEPDDASGWPDALAQHVEDALHAAAQVDRRGSPLQPDAVEQLLGLGRVHLRLGDEVLDLRRPVPSQ